jgi:hypothetical protein
LWIIIWVVYSSLLAWLRILFVWSEISWVQFTYLCWNNWHWHHKMYATYIYIWHTQRHDRLIADAGNFRACTYRGKDTWNWQYVPSSIQVKKHVCTISHKLPMLLIWRSAHILWWLRSWTCTDAATGKRLTGWEYRGE